MMEPDEFEQFEKLRRDGDPVEGEVAMHEDSPGAAEDPAMTSLRRNSSAVRTREDDVHESEGPSSKKKRNLSKDAQLKADRIKQASNIPRSGKGHANCRLVARSLGRGHA